MARVFLSYDREDEPSARAVAASLERSGHSVWWDRQIKGGGEFSAEIEAELDAADKVVVLWSSRAVRSAWVRDEAAVGRETGRLVPATLDGTQPPLGFRQYQTIDLSKMGRGERSASLRALADALDTQGRLPGAEPAPAVRRPLIRPLNPILLLSAAALLILALSVGALVWFWGPLDVPKEVRVAITPGDNSVLSRQVAHDLVLGLGDLPDESSSSYQIVDGATGRAAISDLTLSAGGASQNGRDHRDLSLRSANGDILWSTSIELPSSASANLARQLAVQAQNALSCAAEALTYRRERFGTETVKLYVSACANYDAAYGANVDVSKRINRFEQVISKAPHFQPAWAKLLMSEVGNIGQVDDEDALRRTIKTQISDAQKLGLDFGELYVAKAETFSPDDFIDIFRAYDEGASRHPDNANVYLARSYRDTYVGRMLDAVNDGTHAVQLDPLSPAKLQNLVIVYAYAANIEAAYSELRKAEQLWPLAPSLVSARFAVDFRFGDAKEAAALLNDSALQRGPFQVATEAFLRARTDPSPENVERAIEEVRKIHDQNPSFIGPIVQALAQFGRKDEVLAILLNYSGGADNAGDSTEVLFRPAFRDLWRDPRSIAAAAHLGLLRYWKMSGRWPDFCSDATLPYDCRKEAAKYSV